MIRSIAWIGAGCACLFLVAGCTLDSFSLNAFGTSKGDGPVVAGSLDVVSATAQQAFSDMRIFVAVNRTDGDTVKIAARSPSGKPFTLTLKSRKTDHGDETQLSIHWEKDADDAFWVELAAAIANPTLTAPPHVPDHYVPTEGPPH